MKNPLIHIACAVLACVPAVWAQMNNPYPTDERGKKIYYSSFIERPKHFDPAKSYSSDESAFICQIYEPVVQYHYLKRPYELVPLTAAEMPSCTYYDKDGNVLPGDPPADQVERAVWTIHIKPGIMYQEHPCFARDDNGKLRYHELDADAFDHVQSVFDYEHTGTRELTAHDYVYQIKRLADHRLQCPIFAPVMGKYVKGMTDLRRLLSKRIDAIRDRRKEEQGIRYNRERDEEQNPIVLDYHAFDCDGVEVVDDYTYRVVLNQKYPQFRYWLAMPFFAPVPEEAIRFYQQTVNLERNITIDRYPVGTGAYRLAVMNRRWRIELRANENYHDERYPADGEPGDEAEGFLDDAGKELPLIPRLVYSVEKESAPRWQKFLQGYYDATGISSDNFTQVMDLSSAEGRLSEEMRARGITLRTAVQPTIWYLGFNMRDPVVGTLDEKNCKLRQAICMAINREEYIQIFLNGRGSVAQSPLPPGIFGHATGKDGVNPYTHKWDDEQQRPVRRPLDEAKALLAEAGYPDGIGPDGKQLQVTYATLKRTGATASLDWLKRQFDNLGIELVIQGTDYNRFRQKINNGDFQLFSWGWNADYPDPENFMFLLYGPNGRVKFHGENAANYSNPEYDRLFEQMKSMENGPERLEVIRKMVAMLQHDAPWEFGFFPKSYGLSHAWVENNKPNMMANNIMKYRDIDTEARRAYRREHNQPRLGLVAAAIGVLVLLLAPGVVMAARGMRR